MVRRPKPHRPSLMPVLALAALGAVAAAPALSEMHVEAAAPAAAQTVVVGRGDSLWEIAGRFTPDGGDMQATIDRIRAVNHLRASTVVPGERIRIPS